MHTVLAHYLSSWRRETIYAGDNDWVFPSYKESGRIPMCAGIFVTDYLKPVALKAGVRIEPGQRFGLHSFRSSLATWLTSVFKADPKTAQGYLRHANVETTLGEYAQVVAPELMAAQAGWFADCGVESGSEIFG